MVALIGLSGNGTEETYDGVTVLYAALPYIIRQVTVNGTSVQLAKTGLQGLVEELLRDQSIWDRGSLQQLDYGTPYIAQETKVVWEQPINVGFLEYGIMLPHPTQQARDIPYVWNEMVGVMVSHIREGTRSQMEYVTVAHEENGYSVHYYATPHLRRKRMLHALNYTEGNVTAQQFGRKLKASNDEKDPTELCARVFVRDYEHVKDLLRYFMQPMISERYSAPQERAHESTPDRTVRRVELRVVRN